MSNIVQFVEDVEGGRLSKTSFFKGLAEFVKAIENQLENEDGDTDEVRYCHVISEDDLSRDKEHDLRLAVANFVSLATALATGKLKSSSIFLGTVFEYEISPEEGREKNIPFPLLRGLACMVEIFQNVATAAPLQRWAHIAEATNFSQRSLANLEMRRELHETITRARSPAVQGKEEVVAESRSIGSIIEQAVGTRDELVEDVDMPGYKRALANWSVLLRMFTSDTPQHQILRSRLSKAHLNSAHILIEWWYGTIDSEISSQQAFEKLQSAAQTGLLDQRMLNLSVPGLSPNKSFIAQQTLYGPRGPPYRWAMLRLFQVEFLPFHYSASDSAYIRHSTRKLAAKMAACQRISSSCCGLVETPEYVVHESRNSHLHTADEVVPHENDNQQLVTSSYRDRTSHETDSEVDRTSVHDLIISKSALTRGELSNLYSVIDREAGFKIGASISACEWLENGDIDSDLPHYLWDVKQQRTVVTVKLAGPIEYVAISHTWGRWKIEDPQSPTGSSLVRVRGVDQWVIPENTRFRVQNLPEILSSVPLDVPYLWFDLVCIPQEPVDDVLIRVSKQEIGRQACIFRRAKFAAAWLNDIEGWSGVHAAIRRLSIHFLQEPNGRGCHFPPAAINVLSAEADLDLDLYDSRTVQPRGRPEEAMNGWFNSLWTLQELCLRPDMRLCTRSWEILTVGERGETVVGMDDLVALSEGGNFAGDSTWGDHPASQGQSSSPSTQINPRCKSTEQLWELLDISGLEHLLNASRATILTLGNQRYCRENRAEAIMSAIGITDWHGPTTPEVKATEEYPLAFLREAAFKLGADFYASELGEGELIEMLVLSLEPTGRPRRGTGSMLPFTSSILSRAPSVFEGHTSPTHPSVATWTVLEDRSVDISEAGVISYSGQSRSVKRSLPCTLNAPDLSEPTTLLIKEHKDIDLDDWIDNFLPATRNFAVSLHYGSSISDGILLKELSSGELIKVGTFAITQTIVSRKILPETYAVNWHVL